MTIFLSNTFCFDNTKVAVRHNFAALSIPLELQMEAPSVYLLSNHETFPCSYDSNVRRPFFVLIIDGNLEVCFEGTFYKRSDVTSLTKKHRL